MIRGSQFRICRMVGDKIYPKCQTPKFAASQAKKVTKRKGRMGGKSEYGTQLIEKQKVRYTYGLNERQFSNEVKRAQSKSGAHAADTLYKNLEQRLDNVVFRLGLAPSRAAARQAVGHGHITVNGKKVSIPSYKARTGDTIGIRKGSEKAGMFRGLEERLKGYASPEWLTLDKTKLVGAVRGEPVRAKSLVSFDIPMVLEFYSRA
jgi:small subunit ribosomal protein S4